MGTGGTAGPPHCSLPCLKELTSTDETVLKALEVQVAVCSLNIWSLGGTGCLGLLPLSTVSEKGGEMDPFSRQHLNNLCAKEQIPCAQADLSSITKIKQLHN